MATLLAQTNAKAVVFKVWRIHFRQRYKEKDKIMTFNVVKRNGDIVSYNPDKIFQAISKAYKEVYPMTDDASKKISEIVNKVSYDLRDLDSPHVPISVIQSLIENRLLDYGLFHVAEHYIEYRIQRDIERYGYGDHIDVKLTFKQV